KQEREVISEEQSADNASEWEQPANNRITSGTEQVMETETAEKPVKKKNPIHSTTKQQPEKKHKSNQSQSRKQQTNQTVPFNVMMSANDKRKYRERKRFSDRDRSVSPVKASIPYHLLNDPAPQNSQDQ